MATNQVLIQIKTTPINETLANFEKMKLEIAGAMRNIVEKGALIVAGNAKKDFAPFPGGKRVSKRTGNTWYSFVAPYQAVPPKPTRRSGNLQASIDRRSVRQIGETRFEATVGPTMKYAPYVEFGTAYMKPEPFMQHGLTASLPELRSLFDAEIAQVLK